MNIQPQKNRIRLFKAIALLLPLFILLFLELSLRIAHYGNNLNLFVESSSHPDYLVFNPHASEKYFTNPDFATTGNAELFKKEKDSNTFRIFVLGESTTIGYPYFYNGSFHRWLQYRLMHEFADKNFEIINLSLTAVNSYTIRGFAGELVDYEPDAVLIYVGHNEYYGALGVSSTQTIGKQTALVNLMLKLRELRTVQLLTNVYQYSVKKFVASEIQGDATRMELMVSKQKIPFQSELYKRGINQFRSNMDQTLKLLSKTNIPVFISNLVSNEKDLKPFVSFPVDPKQYPGFDKAFQQAKKAFEKHDFQLAQKHFQLADSIYSEQAMCNFHLGQLACLNHEFKKAKRYFLKAKNLDGLRFRAPEELNEIITQLSNKYPQTYLVDSKKEFENHSENRIIGENLILEHVHPNLKGYALISEAFYQSIKKANILRFNQNETITLNKLLMEMPVTTTDSLAGEYRINNLKGRWPFDSVLPVNPKIESFEAELALKISKKQLSWEIANNLLYEFYINRHNLQEAKKIVEGLVLQHPLDAALFEKAAMLNGELQNYQKAIFYFKKSFELAPTFEKAKYLFVILLKLDQPERAIPFLDYAIQNTNKKRAFFQIKAEAEKIILLQKKHRNDIYKLPVLFEIALSYFKIDNLDSALKYLEMILAIDVDNKEALLLLKQCRTVG